MNLLDRRFYLCYNANAFLETQLPGGVNLNNRHPLRLNVGFLYNKSVGYSRNFAFDHPTLHLGDDTEVEALKGDLNLTRTSQGVYIQGRLSATTSLECVRCLSSFDQTLVAELGDLYTYLSDEATDPLPSIPESGILDLSPLVREYILLDLPIQPVCREDCTGLCPLCGENQNKDLCDHPETEIDPRLAVLKSLLPGS